ncbi:Hypothetical Protein FCC1311_015862 [Hondaea fermentalgiana]|uniref:SAM domain-containing protein n=1 Tax=Hondaea fermentalgiana TaxID=2315210 RepID=A0A2R5G6F2_9STRA|nr:Hypothetical Protein FCC1311_015862 [Hondaea fermentalgiana]|eukprot:GBG25368.1 Hypothetical Protein FCC1311_015862 [Hondaea fermentalgiana]
MDTSTQTFLQDRGLDKFKKPLTLVGVKSINELALLTAQDLESIGMNDIDRRKLQDGIEELSKIIVDGSNGIDASPGSASSGSPQARDSASSSSHETSTTTRKSFSFFRKKKTKTEAESCGSGEISRSSKSSGGNAARRVSASSSSGSLGSARSRGGYNNGGQLDDTRFKTQSHLGLNISLQRKREWDIQQAREAENNHTAVLAMNRGCIDWQPAPKSAYGASTNNTSQGHQYSVGTHKVLSPVTREEVEVPAVRATAQVPGSLQEVMGVLLMYNSQTLRRRMSVLDGTFLYGQVLRVVSPRSADGKSVAYMYPSMPLCTITRNCHQFPEQKSVCDFVVRNHYGYHNEAGVTVGVCAMLSVDEHVEESSSSLDSAPVRGRVFEGSGIVVTPSNSNACKVTFILIASLNEPTCRATDRRGLAKSKIDGARQLEAAVSMVDSIRVFVESQRSLLGDAWCKGDIQTAQPTRDHDNGPVHKTSAAAMKHLVNEEEAQEMQPSHKPPLPQLPLCSESASVAGEGPLAPIVAEEEAQEMQPSHEPPLPQLSLCSESASVAGEGPVAPIDAPPLPPRTDSRAQAHPQKSSQEDFSKMQDISENGPPPMEPLVSPRVTGSGANADADVDVDAVEEKDTNDESADSALQEVSSAVSGGRSTPEATNESEAMRLLKDDLVKAKRQIADLLLNNRSLRDELERRKLPIMPSPGEKRNDFAVAADEELHAELERLRSELERSRILLDKFRPYLPPDIDEDDLGLTLEEAEGRLRNAIQNAMKAETPKDIFFAENETEKYEKIVQNHPDYKLREFEKWRKWEEDQKPQNEAALRDMKEIIKPEYFNMSEDQLIVKGIKPKLAHRIHAKKVLRLLYLTPEEVSKIHYGDLTNQYSPSALDIIEQRAVYAVIPEEFLNDPTGDKAKWRVNIKEKLAELITKEEKNSLRPNEKRHSAYLADKPKSAPGASSGTTPRGLPRARLGGALAGRGAALNALFSAGGQRGPPRVPRGSGGGENPVPELFSDGGPRGPPGGAGGATEDNPVAKLPGPGDPRGRPCGLLAGEDHPVAKFAGSSTASRFSPGDLPGTLEKATTKTLHNITQLEKPSLVAVSGRID